jgi:hypothetical protein
MTIVEAINQHGFPIIAACGLGYFVYYIWTWATKQIDPVVGEAQATLIALIDRIRMLDNDLIRLNQKLNMIIELKEKEIEGNETENRVLDDSKNEKSNTE